MQITITEKAEQMLLKNNIGADKFLRVVISKGGCAGLTYGAEIDQTMNGEEEVVFQLGPIRIVSDSQSVQYLDGLNIDFSDDLIAGGLKFTNSNSGKTCGCGASFSLAGFPVPENGSCGNVK